MRLTVLVLALALCCVACEDKKAPGKVGRWHETSDEKARSEVNAVFAELRVREEAYKAENGTYLSTGATEDATYPATPSQQPQPFASGLPAAWQQLHVHAPEQALCAYVARAGNAGEPTGEVAQVAPFSMEARPAASWYYLLGSCVGYTYFTSSANPTIQRQ